VEQSTAIALGGRGAVQKRLEVGGEKVQKWWGEMNLLRGQTGEGMRVAPSRHLAQEPRPEINLVLYAKKYLTQRRTHARKPHTR
jgi:hypothetical protein